jgi:hypothetical protein
MPHILSTVWTSLGIQCHIRCTLLNQGVFVDVAFIDEDVVQLLNLTYILYCVKEGGLVHGPFEPFTVVDIYGKRHQKHRAR